MSTKPKVSCPHLDHYSIPLEYFFRYGLDVDYVMPPPISSRTVALGCSVSPTEVCMPFKLTLGTYLEALEAGADTLVATGGICRLNFFGALQEQILRDLGKEVRFVDLQPDYFHVSTIFREFHSINPKMKMARAIPAFFTGLKITSYMDQVEAYINANYGFARDRAGLLQRQDRFLSDLRQLHGRQAATRCYRDCMADLEAIPLDKPDHPLRVGLTGEFYTLLDPTANHHIERELGGMGVEVHRFLNVTNALVHYPAKQFNALAAPYMADSMGVTTRVTAGTALLYIQEGYDGIIHVKSFGCMPEVDASVPLQNISQDHHIPILSLSYDALTEDTGLQTRLEAFYDMLCMRRQKQPCPKKAI